MWIYTNYHDSAIKLVVELGTNHFTAHMLKIRWPHITSHNRQYDILHKTGRSLPSDMAMLIGKIPRGYIIMLAMELKGLPAFRNVQSNQKKREVSNFADPQTKQCFLDISSSTLRNLQHVFACVRVCVCGCVCVCVCQSRFNPHVSWVDHDASW